MINISELNNIQQIVRHLEIHQMRYYPKKYLKKYVQTTKDIYELRHSLKEISFDDYSIEYIISIVVTDLKNNKRFKKFECLKVIKRILKNRIYQNALKNDVVNYLFYIYQYFIFSDNEDVQWCVSTYIKDQLLEEKNIKWLIDNYSKSVHLVNRLLRYPVYNRHILQWAKYAYKNELIEDNRMSEVLGILITRDIPKYVSCDTDTLMWGIYYSKCSIQQKERLMLNNLDKNNYYSALEVAFRLNLPSISQQLIDYYRNKGSGNGRPLT